MKKILLVIAIAIGFWSCQKEETPEDVTFKLTYSLDKGTSMTRAGEDLYASFYENFVKTKKVGHPWYDIAFYKGEELVAVSNGYWNATLITLPEGEYIVKGMSKSKKTGIWNTGENDQHSTLSLVFDEKITLSKGQTSVILHPSYDCYLLFGDSSIFAQIELEGTAENSSGVVTGSFWAPNRCSFFDAGGIKYAFINSESLAKKIKYTTVDDDSGELTIETLGFKLGKYYCLDAVATGYQLPPMENGF